MNKTELLDRLTDIEWDDFEVKEARSELPKSVWETVSSFSNAAGGWLFLGVSRSTLWRHVCSTGCKYNGQGRQQNYLVALSRIYAACKPYFAVQQYD